jgi:hypothetical protein
VETAEHAAVAALAALELRGSAFGLLAAVQSFGNLAASAIAGLAIKQEKLCQANVTVAVRWGAGPAPPPTRLSPSNTNEGAPGRAPPHR